MAYELPDLPEIPTLISTTVPTPLSITEITIPTRMAAFTNTISSDKTNTKLNNWVYTRYGNAIQSLIDSQIETLLTDDGDEEFDTKIGILKETILYEAKQQNELVLAEASSKGHCILPGSYKKKILLIEKDTKKELEQKMFELFADSAKIAQDNLDFAMQAGIEKEAKLFQHHDKVQMANADAAIAIAKGLYQTYKAFVEIFNIELQEFEIAIRNCEIARQNRLDVMKIYLLQLDGYIIEGQNNIYEHQLVITGIKSFDLENELNRTNLALLETNIAIKKGTLQTYKSNLQLYMSQLEIISATYAGYMADAMSSKVDKDIYLQDLERSSLEIQNDNLETEKDKLKMKNDLMLARIALEAFKNSVSEYQAEMEVAQTQYDVTKSDYNNTLIEFSTELNDAFTDTEISFDANLSLMEEEAKETIGYRQNDGTYTLEQYRSKMYAAYIESSKGFTACTITQNSIFETDANTTLNLIHDITES